MKKVAKAGRPKGTTAAKKAQKNSRSQAARAIVKEQKEEDKLVEEVINPITNIKLSKDMELAVIEMQAKGFTYDMVVEELGAMAPTKKDYAALQESWKMSPEEFVRLQSKKYQLLENKVLDNLYRRADELEPHQLSMALSKIADLRATNMGMPNNITATVNVSSKKRDLKSILSSDIPQAIKRAEKA